MKAVVLLYLLHASFLQASAQFSWDTTTAPTGPAEDATENFSWHGSDEQEDTEVPGGACDISSHACGCCVMVQEVNRMEMYINETLTKFEEEQKNIHETLDLCNNSRAAFTASLHAGENWHCKQNTSHTIIIVYKNVFLNLGNAYNNDTGIFTVPFNGVYSVLVTVYSDAGYEGNDMVSCATLHVGDDEIASVIDRNMHDQEDSATIAVALQLTIGAEVFVKLRYGCKLCENDHYNTFSVFLLYLI